MTGAKYWEYMDKTQEWVEKIIKELRSINTLILLNSIEEIRSSKLNRSQHAILIWIYFLQTGVLKTETEFKSANG
jgi:hypothetical protein